VDEESRTATGQLEGMPAHLELTDERLAVRIGDEAVPRYDVAFHRITQVDAGVGLMTGFLTVHLGAEKLVFSHVPKAEVRPMADALRILMARPDLAADEPPVGGHVPSPLEEIERLGRLRESGTITSEEFDEAKRRLLDKL